MVVDEIIVVFAVTKLRLSSPQVKDVSAQYGSQVSFFTISECE